MELKNCKECGHSSSTHLHNPTGEMFGSVLLHCAWCKCKQWVEPDEVEKPNAA